MSYSSKALELTKVANVIKEHEVAGRPLLIAIEGFGGSGKSTIATALSNSLGNAYVVSIDDFIVKAKLTEPSWDTGSFDRARLEQQVLSPATTGKVIKYQKLIWETDTLSELVQVPRVAYLIVEGISSFHPGIAHHYDYKIWIDTPIELAKKRGHARDGSNENAQHWDLWAENDLRYQTEHHTKQAADFIIENSAQA